VISTADSTSMIQYQYNGGYLNQQWKFAKLPNGSYSITNACSGLKLDDPGWSTASGTQMIQYSEHAPTESVVGWCSATTTTPKPVSVPTCASARRRRCR
jgi:hypothetical protein